MVKWTNENCEQLVLSAARTNKNWIKVSNDFSNVYQAIACQCKFKRLDHSGFVESCIMKHFKTEIDLLNSSFEPNLVEFKQLTPDYSKPQETFLKIFYRRYIKMQRIEKSNETKFKRKRDLSKNTKTSTSPVSIAENSNSIFENQSFLNTNLTKDYEVTLTNESSQIAEYETNQETTSSQISKKQKQTNQTNQAVVCITVPLITAYQKELRKLFENIDELMKSKISDDAKIICFQSLTSI
jgi:hypothetical protein